MKIIKLVQLILSIVLLISCFGCAKNTTSNKQSDSPQEVDEVLQQPLLEVYNQLGPYHQVSEMGWHIHDPTRIQKIGDQFTIGVTGKENSDGYECGFETWVFSSDDNKWLPGQCLLMIKPDWIKEQLPGNGGAYWAPAFVTENRMYYSVSSGFDDGVVQAVGMVEADGTPPDIIWKDSGGPIAVSHNPEENDKPEPTAIDPAVFIDDDVKHYLVYGGGHIWMTELDPETGKPLSDEGWSVDNPDYHHLANGPNVDDEGNEVSEDEELWIEAPFLYKQDEHYYLFVNWYACCRGLESTYEIRVGRSESPIGPFLDREGVDMKQGGGTLVVDREGSILGDPKYIGPGHAGIYEHTDGRLAVSFHYYDGTDYGTPKLGLAEIEFVDGWPQITNTGFNLNN